MAQQTTRDLEADVEACLHAMLHENLDEGHSPSEVCDAREACSAEETRSVRRLLRTRTGLAPRAPCNQEAQGLEE